MLAEVQLLLHRVIYLLTSEVALHTERGKQQHILHTHTHSRTWKIKRSVGDVSTMEDHR